MKHLCGQAIQIPEKVNYFQFRGYSKSHIKELISWVESFKDSPKEIITIEEGNVYINTVPLRNMSLVATDYLIRDKDGGYYINSKNTFETNYNRI